MTSGPSTQAPARAPDLSELLTSEGLSDPTAAYARWRSWERDNGTHPTLVLGHDCITEVFADRDISAARVANVIASASTESQVLLEPVQDLLLSIVAFVDPPDHTRIRRLMSRSFTPRVVRHQEESVRAIADRLVTAMANSDERDLVASIAYPMPSLVVGAMLGVDEADLDKFGRWALTIVEFIGAQDPSDTEARALADALGETRDYLSQLAAKRRANPTDDLFSSMLQVSLDEPESAATDDELFANALFLMTAGHETATNGITNGVLALLQHPEQRQLLVERPELIGPAIDEMLRYDSPIQISARICDADRHIAGRDRKAGDPIVLILGAGNHDPNIFREPGSFDITRNERRHLSFGHGRHYCLGASLAQSEMRVVLLAILREMPGLELVDPDALTWQRTLNFRGVRSLPVTW